MRDTDGTVLRKFSAHNSDEQGVWNYGERQVDNLDRDTVFCALCLRSGERQKKVYQRVQDPFTYYNTVQHGSGFGQSGHAFSGLVQLYHIGGRGVYRDRIYLGQTVGSIYCPEVRRRVRCDCNHAFPSFPAQKKGAGSDTVWDRHSSEFSVYCLFGFQNRRDYSSGQRRPVPHPVSEKKGEHQEEGGQIRHGSRRDHMRRDSDVRGNTDPEIRVWKLLFFRNDGAGPAAGTERTEESDSAEGSERSDTAKSAESDAEESEYAGRHGRGGKQYGHNGQYRGAAAGYRTGHLQRKIRSVEERC